MLVPPGLRKSLRANSPSERSTQSYATGWHVVRARVRVAGGAYGRLRRSWQPGVLGQASCCPRPLKHTSPCRPHRRRTSAQRPRRSSRRPPSPWSRRGLRVRRKALPLLRRDATESRLLHTTLGAERGSRFAIACKRFATAAKSPSGAVPTKMTIGAARSDRRPHTQPSSRKEIPSCSIVDPVLRPSASPWPSSASLPRAEPKRHGPTSRFPIQPEDIATCLRTM
jgi:hypothetical protein